MIPDYYNIGLPKTVTTSLQSILKNDNRFDLFCKKRIFQTTNWYDSDVEKIFRVKDNKVGFFSDESFLRQQGRNFKHTVSLERLRFKNPNAKIIVTIREQKSFLESRYKHGIVRGNISSNF